MKTRKVFFTIMIILAPMLLLAQTGEADKGGIIGWLSGAGLTLLGGVVVWAKKHFKGITRKIKEVIDIPLAVTTGLSNVSTEIAQASGAITSLLQTMESFAQNDDMSAKELVEKFKVQKDAALKELKDIPKAVDEAGKNIRKEINDLMQANDE